jgi:hypothetical protein
MDFTSILGIISKGVGVINTLATIGQDVAPAVKVVTELITNAQSGSVTPEQLNDTEASLDAMIADFNDPMG